MKYGKILFSFIFLIALFLSVARFANSQTCSNESDCNKLIDEYTNQVLKLQGQGNTLKSQILQFDAQIKLTSLKIAQTEEQISLLSGRIDQIEGSLGSLTSAFSERAVETYKMARIKDPLLLLISSDNLSEAFNRFSYLKKIQEGDRDLLNRLQTAKDTYNEQKLDQEDLQKQLETQQKQLNTQKLAKKTLLDQTKSDEKKYQALLAEALAEKSAIERALVSGTKVGPVKAGDPIALVGNSGYPGCSTGKHLHFEIRKNNIWVDPSSYLQNKSVNDEEKGGTANIGSGSWQWPLSDTIRLTQHYGHTPWSWKYSYSGGIHTGLDMVSTSSDVIRAPADGNLFKSSQSCGGSSTINIVYIEHNDGVISLYLHVQ
ncbi:MAG: peptidoglycan DD-metalloendopeptidase family protein [Patescibacteria group bacterium]